MQTFNWLPSPIWLEIVGERAGKALCVAVIDYGPDHDLIWVCFDRETRECWSVPNKFVRYDMNFSLGFIHA